MSSVPRVAPQGHAFTLTRTAPSASPLALLIAAAAVAGCGEDPSGPSEPPGPVATAVVVDPEAVTVPSGEPVRFRLLGLDSAGTVLDTLAASWQTEDPSVVRLDSVSGGAWVRARAPGEARLFAVPEGLDSMIAVAEVTVTALRFRQVSDGGPHSCGVTENDRAFCWGENHSGELGDGTEFSRNYSPAPVTGDLEFREVSAWSDHTCGVTLDGEAYCWGSSDGGALGDGRWDGERLEPFPVQIEPADLRFQSITAGGGFTCALTVEGRAYCWGRNRSGSLGNGSGADSNVPVAVTGGLAFASLEAGSSHACGVTPDGTGFCWGANGGGGLGDGTLSDGYEPVPVVGEHTWRSITPGSGYTCGVTTENVAYCWGRNNRHGRLGNGTSESGATYPTPTPVATELRFEHVGAGVSTTCGLTVEGEAYCWGSNLSARLGRPHSELSSSAVPVSVVGGLVFRRLGRGYPGCGVATDDLVYCWGGGGQPGNPEPRPIYGQR